MVRYSCSTTFVPSYQGPGHFTFYLTINRWEDEKCMDSKVILTRDCSAIPEASDLTPKMDWAADLADISWNLIVTARSAEHREAVRGPNPLWPDTTGKPMDM